MTRIKTDWSKYGVIDTKILEEKEEAFFNAFYALCNEQSNYLKECIKQREMAKKANKIIEVSNKRKHD